eukprot:5186635-Prymnesium_polylepis.1
MTDIDRPSSGKAVFGGERVLRETCLGGAKSPLTNSTLRGRRARAAADPERLRRNDAFRFGSPESKRVLALSPDVALRVWHAAR